MVVVAVATRLAGTVAACHVPVHVHVNRQLALAMDSGDRVAAGTERPKPGVAGRGSKKRQPVPLSLKQKAWIVFEREKGLKPKEIADALGRTPSTIYTVLAKKDAILAEWKSGLSTLTKKRFSGSRFPVLENALLDWFTETRSTCPQLPITLALLQEKAYSLADHLGMTDVFRGSLGFITRFKERHAIVSKAVRGEALSVPQVAVSKWKEEVLPTLLASYSPKDVYNGDETGVFFEVLPNRGHCFKGERCLGGKSSKKRITALVCANMDGSDKLLPVIIGKSMKPRCFKGVKSLPLPYKANKKSWMTGELFKAWLSEFDDRMRRQRRNILLFLDNCSAHTKAVAHLKLHNIRVEWLVANSSAVTQPMDQGVIRSFKASYRKMLLQKVLTELEAGKPVPTTTLKDAIFMLHSAWQAVTPATIAHCFRHAGFNVESVATSEDDRENDKAVEDQVRLINEHRILSLMMFLNACGTNSQVNFAITL